MKRVLAIILALALFVAAFSGCGNTADDTSGDNTEVRVITVGYYPNGQPIIYSDENGDPQGYEIEVLKLVDERLEDVTFEYEAVDQDAIQLGLESGEYQIGASNFYYTDERAAKFIYPEENTGASLVSVIVRTEYQDTVKNLNDVYEQNFSLVPIPASNANYTILKQWNENNPDKQLNLESAAELIPAEALKWVAEGRYDAVVGPSTVYDQIRVEGGLSDQLVVQEPFTALPTYNLFNTNEQELADRYSAILKELKEDGTLGQLAVDFFGVNIHEYVNN